MHDYPIATLAYESAAGLHAPTPREQLEKIRETLTEQLAQVNKALVLLDKSPDVEEILTTFRKVGL